MKGPDLTLHSVEPADRSVQVFESPELVELILGALWPHASWPALVLLSQSTRRICDDLGRRLLSQCGSTPAGSSSPLRALEVVAQVFLCGGAAAPRLSCQLLAHGGLAGHLPLRPASQPPEPGHGCGISIAAVGGSIFVTSDFEHMLGPGQQWEPGEVGGDLEIMPTGRAHVSRYDPQRDLWEVLDAPPPTDDQGRGLSATHAYAVSAALGSFGGALVFSGGECYGLRRDCAPHLSRSCHRLQPEGTWSALPPMCVARSGHSLCAHGGWLYAAAGVAATEPPSDLLSVERHVTHGGSTLATLLTDQSQAGRWQRSGGLGSAKRRADEARGQSGRCPVRQVERFDGAQWGRIADVPREAGPEPASDPVEASESSLQLLVCACRVDARPALPQSVPPF